MAEPYKERIQAYCEANGIEIPIGFHRHSASRYAAIDREASPPKLVAKTWFNQEDVVYFLKNLASGKNMQILDFKEYRELLFEGGERLQHGNGFQQGIHAT